MLSIRPLGWVRQKGRSVSELWLTMPNSRRLFGTVTISDTEEKHTSLRKDYYHALVTFSYLKAM